MAMCTFVQYTESTRDATYEYGVTTSSVQFSSIVEKLYQIIISNTQATENFLSLVKRNNGSFTNKKFNVNSSIFALKYDPIKYGKITDHASIIKLCASFWSCHIAWVAL